MEVRLNGRVELRVEAVGTKSKSLGNLGLSHPHSVESEDSLLVSSLRKKYAMNGLNS